MRIISAALAALLAVLPAAGCWDRRELEETTFVSTIGFDLGADRNLRIAFQFPVPSAPQQGEGMKSHMTVVESESILEAKDIANTHVGRRINLAQSVAFVIGEELAKKSLERILTPLSRDREIRGTIWLLIVKGTALDFLQANTAVLEHHGGRYLTDIAETWNYTGFHPPVHIIDYYLQTVSEGAAAVVTIAAVNKGFKGNGDSAEQDDELRAGEIRRWAETRLTDIVGSGVIVNEKLVGELDGRETRIRNMISGDFKSATMKFKDPSAPERIWALNVKRGSPPEISIQPDSRPRIVVRISLEADVTGFRGDLDYTNLRNTKKIEGIFRRELEEDARELIARAQKEFRNDIFRLARQARKMFLTTKEWEEYNWPKRFAEAEIIVHFDLEVRRFGFQLGPMRARKE